MGYCEACQTNEVETKKYHEGVLCQICASTCAGNALLRPNEDKEAVRAMVQIVHLLLREIQKLKEGRE